MTPSLLRPASGPADPERPPSLSGRSLLATLGVWLGLSLVAVGATTLALRGLESTNAARYAGPIAVAEVYGAFVAAALIVLRGRLAATVALRRTSGFYPLVACVAFAASYAVTFLAHLMLSPLLGPWSATVALLRATGSDDGRLAHAEPLLMIIVLGRACVLAPLAEELLFRGALFSWLRQHVSAGWTIAITATGFALIHGYPPLMLLGFVLGVASGWVRERTGSAIPTLVAHVSHNLAMVAFSYATTGWTARLPAWGHS